MNKNKLGLAIGLHSRVQKYLQKYKEHEGKIYTIQQLIENGILTNPHSFEQCKYHFNRLKHFRMNKEESEAYDKKLEETITVYAFDLPDGFYLKVPKIVYDYWQYHCTVKGV